MSRVLARESSEWVGKWKICAFQPFRAFSTISESICYVKRGELSARKVDCSCAIVLPACNVHEETREQLANFHFFLVFFRGNGSSSGGLFILNSLTTVGWGKKVRQRYFLPEIWRYVCVDAVPSITSYRLFDSLRMMIIWDSFSAFLLSSLTHSSLRSHRRDKSTHTKA